MKNKITVLKLETTLTYPCLVSTYMTLIGLLMVSLMLKIAIYLCLLSKLAKVEKMFEQTRNAILTKYKLVSARHPKALAPWL